MRETNKAVIAQFRAGGEIEGMQRARLVLLTTTGRRTGEPRTTPMMFHRARGRLFVIASNIGAPHHPDWYLNLVSTPAVRVEIGDTSFPATATTLTGADRDEVWTELKALYPFFAEHEAKTEREIPVVELVRTPDDSR